MKDKEIIEIAWKRNDGLIRTSITVQVSGSDCCGMVKASNIYEYLGKVLKELLKNPEESAMDIKEECGPDETVGHA